MADPGSRPRGRLFRFPRRNAAQVAADVEEELGFHLDLVARELMADGWPPEAARLEARRRFGDLDGTRQVCTALGRQKERQMRWIETLSALGQDLRYAARQLAKAPAFTLVAVLTLALGIGATTAIWSVVDHVLLAPLRFPEPDRLVRAIPINRQGEEDAFSMLNFLDWRAGSRTLAGAAVYSGKTLNLSGGGEPERVPGVEVSASFFSVLGSRPLLGRFFLPDEDRAGAPRVAVLSEALWRRRFGADRGIVGRPISLNGQPHTVIGVVDGRSRFPFTPEIWVPLELDALVLNPGNRGALYLGALARLAPGVSLTRAGAEAAAIGRRLAAQYPEAIGGYGLRLVPLQAKIVGDARTPLLVLLGAVGLVLLIACANVANLLLVRAAAREGEIAVRAALGAGRERIVRQLLTESVALALLGGTAGVALAFGLTRLLVKLAPAGIPRLEEVRVDGSVLLFALAATLVTGFLFGLVPALQASRPDLQRTLKEGSRGAAGGGRARQILVMVEQALAVVLLAGAGLLLQSFVRLGRVDLGFEAERVVSFRLALPESQYPEDPQVLAFADALFERLGRIPGVATAGSVLNLPLSGSDFTLSFDVVGRPPAPPGQEEALRIQIVTPEYFRALHVPLVAGRLFAAPDRLGAPQVVLLNQAAVRRYFPAESPLGKRIELGWREDGVRRGGEVVGIVGDVKQVAPGEATQPELYLPFRQVPVRSLSVVLRTSGDLGTVAAAARQQVRELDPNLPIWSLGPLTDAVDGAAAERRFYTGLLGGFAVLALLLSAVGIYGVVAFAVGQKRQEIGIRMALGASRDRVLRGVVGQGLGVALLGTAAGLAGALVATRGLERLLYQVSATDPPTYAAVAAVLVLVAALASYVPARRAARTEPSLAMRGE